MALGSRGFRNGIHYWEITIQRYDDKPDPAFGIARFDVMKEHMLGKYPLFFSTRNPLSSFAFQVKIRNHGVCMSILNVRGLCTTVNIQIASMVESLLVQ